MKKFLMAALIGATVLTPIAATAQERGERRGRGDSETRLRAERPAQREMRQRGERSEQTQRQTQQQPRAAQQPAPQPAQQQVQGRQQQQREAYGAERRDDRRDFRQDRRDDRRDLRQGQTTPQQWRQDRRDDRRDYRQDRRDDRRDYRQDTRRYGDWRDQQQYRRGWDDNRSWNRGWRGDNRYNWNSYRQRNRNIFRLPRYYAPSGWNYGYRRFSIGLTLGSILFSPSYWINDPFYYRLPPAYGPYRWVRYYNDALLVDIRDGYVVDVIYDIFW